MLLLALGLVLSACASPGSAEICGGDELPGVRPGVCLIDPADRRSAPTDAMPRLDGSGELSLGDLRGRVVVLNFWASWCGPCRREQPELNDAAGRLPDDRVAFLGVDLQDTRPNGRAHAREFSIPYPSLFDPDSRFAARFEGVGPRSIPSTLLIDEEGRVAARLFGETNARELLVLVDRLLAGGEGGEDLASGEDVGALPALSPVTGARSRP